MNEKDKTQMQTLIIYLLVIILIIVLLSMFIGVKPGDVDVLAFIGSIIGGVITLGGVYYTIKSSFDNVKLTLKEQEKNSFVESYPVKMKNLNEITDAINVILRDLNYKDFYRVIRISSSLEPLIDKAVYVDGIVYETLTELESQIQSIVTEGFEEGNAIYAYDEWGEMKIVEGKEESSIETIDYLKEVTSKANQKLKTHKTSVRDKFLSYTKL